MRRKQLLRAHEKTSSALKAVKKVLYAIEESKWPDQCLVFDVHNVPQHAYHQSYIKVEGSLSAH